MKITHVIRGEEWLPSTPKHILLYRAFGWGLPVFVHLPNILNNDRSKLSKRHGQVKVEDYLIKGYIPDALINFVALLGWHPTDNRETFSLAELTKEFQLERVQKSGAIFDLEKLNWLNHRYIQKLPDQDLMRMLKPYLKGISDELLEKIVTVQKTRLKVLADIKALSLPFVNLPNYDKSMLVYKKSTDDKARHALDLAIKNLKELDVWEVKTIKEVLEKIVDKTDLTNGDVFWPVRVAASGLEKSPPPEEVLWILGLTEGLDRLERAFDKLSINKDD